VSEPQNPNQLIEARLGLVCDRLQNAVGDFGAQLTKGQNQVTTLQHVRRLMMYSKYLPTVLGISGLALSIVRRRPLISFLLIGTGGYFFNQWLMAPDSDASPSQPQEKP
jgi:hypothetical protein